MSTCPFTFWSLLMLICCVMLSKIKLDASLSGKEILISKILLQERKEFHFNLYKGEWAF